MLLSRLARLSSLPFALLASLSLSLSACGYSQEEWDQKLRENEKLAAELKAQREAQAQQFRERARERAKTRLQRQPAAQ